MTELYSVLPVGEAREMHLWHQAHEDADNERAAEAERQERNKAIRERAVSKLTADEKAVLGIK